MSSGPEQESNALLDACRETLRAEARLFGARRADTSRTARQRRRS